MMKYFAHPLLYYNESLEIPPSSSLIPSTSSIFSALLTAERLGLDSCMLYCLRLPHLLPCRNLHLEG
jgi:hypothetical protein